MSNPIGRIAHTIVTRAMDSQISAIQIKLEADRMAVYYYSGGAIDQQINAPAHIFPRVVTRYKIWANVDLLDRRYPLKGQFPLIHARRHYSIEVVWEDPRHDPGVTLSIVAGGEAEVEEDGPEELFIL